MTSTDEIRRSFLDHFAAADHAVIPSAPLVPYNDPTLMFVNAGMVPFKDVFTGAERSQSPRAASAQKCVRAGGKHNDLDNVGYTARHHTFFEMLGNFSFGDYFKAQAIELAWDLLTREWGLTRDRLTVTVFHTDDEAADLWRRIGGLPDERIIRIPTADNFWSMGDTGPCGPCSEIFYDHGDHIPGGPPGSPDEDGDRFVEIWNLVFMQFDSRPDGSRHDLPRPSIDTGMGLERVAAVLQGVHDNYDIDLFRGLIRASEEATGTKAEGPARASHRVIADHLRAIGFLLADGVMPSNEGRGYVLRRIMRRAMRHARLLGVEQPVLHRLVPALVGEMGAAYPELARAQANIASTLEREEVRFVRALDTGLRLLDEETAHLPEGASLSGRTAFKLYDTYGFPLDLTEDALRARGMNVDRAGFDDAMADQKTAARAAWTGSGDQRADEVWYDLADRHGATEFTGYLANEGEATVLALVRDGAEVASAGPGERVRLLANQTPFYATSGGQQGDTGIITTPYGASLRVEGTTKLLGRLHVHEAVVEEGAITSGDTAHLAINKERRAQLCANHSATHLLHAALRERLGGHVAQKGSLVALDRLRFDFSQPVPLTSEDLEAVERDVNAQVRGNGRVRTRLMSPDEAIAGGAMALFGEKYGDQVRVLTMGGTVDEPYSMELCGGTHVEALGEIGVVRIIGESAVASGVRRIEALTGEAARRWLADRDERLCAAAATLRSTPDEVPDRVAQLIDDRRRLERELAEARRALALGGTHDAVTRQEVAGVKFVGQVLHDVDPKALRSLVDDRKREIASGAVVLVAATGSRAAVAVGVTDDLSDRASAVDLVRPAVAALGGQGGGGRPDLAQGGGPNGDGADQAIEAAREAFARALTA